MNRLSLVFKKGNTNRVTALPNGLRDTCSLTLWFGEALTPDAISCTAFLYTLSEKRRIYVHVHYLHERARELCKAVLSGSRNMRAGSNPAQGCGGCCIGAGRGTGWYHERLTCYVPPKNVQRLLSALTRAQTQQMKPTTIDGFREDLGLE